MILPGFEGVPLFEVLQYFFRQLKISNLTERTSAIAFNFLMSIPPTCLFLFTLIPNLPFVSKKNLKIQLHQLIDDVTPAKVHDHTLINFINSFIDGTKVGLISSGFLLSLFFASNAIMGVMRSFAKDYVGFEKRNGLQKRWAAIKLTCLLFTLILACILLLLTQSVVLEYLGMKNNFFKQLIVNGRWVVICCLLFYSFAFIYKYAPPVSKRWKLLTPGAVLATLLSIILTMAFSSFVNNFNRYNILYGSIGTIIVIMIMIFLNSLVVLIGFEFNVSIKSLKAFADEKKENKIDVSSIKRK
jgi:membrane protein